MIEPFMPSQPARGRRRKTSLRAVIDAIFYLLQSGCQWALLPHDIPPNSTVHHYFKRFFHQPLPLGTDSVSLTFGLLEEETVLASTRCRFMHDSITSHEHCDFPRDVR